jgi:hypothetical protein
MNKGIRLPGNQSAGDLVSGDQEKEDRNSCPDTLRSDILLSAKNRFMDS